MSAMPETAQPDALSAGPVPVVADHELLRRIGAGAYGEVWLARSVAGAYRAVKVVWRANFEHERIYEREFTGLKRFEPSSRLHPGLTDVLQIGRDDRAGYFYYVIELADPAEGSEAELPDRYVPLTLGELLRRRGRLPVGECAHIGAAIAEALEFLHRQGLVHRDVKPSNIIFVGGQPKLADIGLVTGLGDARSFVGTEGFIPPEGPGSPQSDLYSLGKVLYEMATGKSRLDFPDLPGGLQTAGDMAEFAELNEIILRACSPEAARRHQTAEELRGELLLVDAGRSVRRLRRNERLLAWWRRFAVVAALVGMIGLMAVLIERDRTQRANQLAAAEAAQRQLIADKERSARQNLYAADMNLAQQAIEAGNYGRAEELLAAYLPEAGGDDLRGFEWFHFWQRVRGDNVGVLRGHDQVVSSLLLSRDGQRLFSAGFDSTIREWSLTEQRELRRWSLPGCLIMAMAQDAAGTRLAVEGGNRPMSGILELATGNWVTNVSSASPSIAFAPEGNRLVRGARMFLFETNGVVEVTDLSLRTERVLQEAGGRAWFSPDGRLLVTGSWGHALKLWSWPELEPQGQLADVGLVLGLAFSPDGSRLATGSRDGRLMLWDVPARRRLHERRAHDGTIIWSLAFSPDGTRLASAGNDQTVRAWDAATLTEQHIFRGHGSEVWSVLWLPDGRRLVSAGKDTTIRLWDAVQEAAPLELADVAQVAAFSQDERLVAVRQRKDGLNVWETASGRRVLALGAAGELGGFSTDGTALTLLRPDWTFERRAVADGRLLDSRPVTPPAVPFTRRLLTADGHWLVTGDADGLILVQDLTTNLPPRSFAGHDQMVVALQVSPDGRQLVSGSLDRTARLWDLATGRELHRFEGHKMAVASVAFSPDATRLVTGSWDDTAFVWDTATRGRLAVFGGHANSVHGVAFAPGGRTLAVLSGTGVIKFWSLAAQREAGMIALDRGTGLGWLTFSPGGQWLAAASQSGRFTLVPAPRGTAENSR
jgi:WD40 repeat protein